MPNKTQISATTGVSVTCNDIIHRSVENDKPRVLLDHPDPEVIEIQQLAINHSINYSEIDLDQQSLKLEADRVKNTASYG